jgi:hypothetical protein
MDDDVPQERCLLDVFKIMIHRISDADEEFFQLLYVAMTIGIGLRELLLSTTA